MIDRLKRILIVDREKLLVDLISQTLPTDLVRVLSADSCDEAKRLIAQEPMDLLLIDPGFKGAAELIAELKRSDHLASVVSFTESPQQEATATAAGMEFVRKSGELADLLRILELKLGIPLVKPGTRRILVVDDDAGVSAFVRACLIDEGYFVYVASNGRDALELLDKHPSISVVLLDIMMPERGGIDTLCEIEKKKGAPSVIMMTGVCDAGVAEMAFKAGASDYITKPLDTVKITSAVDAAVAHLDYAR